MPTTPNDVEVLIAGKAFRAIPEIGLEFHLDGIDVFDFTAPFESTRADFREAFRPFSFKELMVSVNDETLLTGTLVGVNPTGDATSSAVSVSGYSRPGVMADCPMPAGTPLEFHRLNLRAIATALAAPFDVDVAFEASPGAAFDVVKIEADQPPYPFLADLARQRNLVIGSGIDGGLVFLQSTAGGHPVARLIDGQNPVTRVAATFGPQNYFSEVTGYGTAKRGKKGSRHTVQNPFLRGVIRPTSVTFEDTAPAGIERATAAKLGRMFSGACSWEVDVATWRTPAGDLWAPNTTVTLRAPDQMVYRETELLVRTVHLRQTAMADVATLRLVLPGAFTGEVPEVLPWDET